MVFFLSYNFVTYLCCFFGANKLDFHRFFCYRIRRQFFKRISHSQLIYGHSSRRGPSAHVFFFTEYLPSFWQRGLAGGRFEGHWVTGSVFPSLFHFWCSCVCACVLSKRPRETKQGKERSPFMIRSRNKKKQSTAQKIRATHSEIGTKLRNQPVDTGLNWALLTLAKL